MPPPSPSTSNEYEASPQNRGLLRKVGGRQKPMMKSVDDGDIDRRSAHSDRAIPADQTDPPTAFMGKPIGPCRKEETAMSSTTTREAMRFPRQAPALPTAAEVEAMLQAVNVQSIQHNLAPEPAISPEAGWTVASVVVGAIVGCLGAILLIGGWLSALAGSILGAAAGGVFAVILWRASDGGGSLSTRPVFASSSMDDDLLSGW